MIGPYVLLRFDGAVWRRVSDHGTPRTLKAAANAIRDSAPGVELAWTDSDGSGGLSAIHYRKADRRYGAMPQPRDAPIVL